MGHSCGDHVIYSNYGVCQVAESTTRPDPRNPAAEVTYYTLMPLNERLGKVLIPKAKLDTLRPALTKDEALDLIDRVETISVDEFMDKSHKSIEDHFRQLLRSGSIEDLVCVVKSMHSRLDKQSELGKNPSSSYLRLQKEARSRFHAELAYALDIDEGDVEDFIVSRING